MSNTGNQYGRTWRSYDINFDFEQTQRALKKTQNNINRMLTTIIYGI